MAQGAAAQEVGEPAAVLPIVLRNARTHNLQGVSLRLLPCQFVAITGPSGSGKSSLAQDTLFAEGQRRFVESFAPYVRQFLERVDRPPVDKLDPIAATVAVDRKAPVRSSRSTLATMTDIEPFLSLLFGSEATPYCAACDMDAVATDPSTAAARVVAEFAGQRAAVTYAERISAAETYLSLRESLVADGYRRILLGGELCDVDDVRPSDAVAHAKVEVVVDRTLVCESDQARLGESIAVAWKRSGGRARVHLIEPRAAAPSGTRRGSKKKSGVQALALVRGLTCPGCSASFEPPDARMFSYNSPLGACPECRGFGRIIGVDYSKVVPDGGLSLRDGAIKPWTGKSAAWERRVLAKFCERESISMDTPWSELSDRERSRILEGEGSYRAGKYPGVVAWFRWLESRAYKMHVRVLLSRYRDYALCPSCKGARLAPGSRRYRVGGYDLPDLHGATVERARHVLEQTTPRSQNGIRARAELQRRLAFLEAAGLGYLTLDRQAKTLSGGEAQRAALTSALGCDLTGTLFVLDEPTTGLHPMDVEPLVHAIRGLARRGNIVLAVEHDPVVVGAADRVVELGPGAGKAGGEIIFDGSPDELRALVDLPTARAQKRPLRYVVETRTPRGWLELRGVTANNLVDVSCRFPLGALTAVTGPSGSGKSTLVDDVLHPLVASALGDRTRVPLGTVREIRGTESLASVVCVDQSPLGRTARGNAATYTKAWDRIRGLFADTRDARLRGMTASHFSFNVAIGRCEACAGEGHETVEMQFLADVTFSCPSCHGRRFSPEVLAVRYGDRNIFDVLSMTVDEVRSWLSADDAILERALAPVSRVGLGYLPLGQPLSTLSGGEAQRLKLARALGARATNTLFIFDEPSAGLHAEDVQCMLSALSELIDAGGTVIVVEHDLDVLRRAHWAVDLGPGAGPHGGRVLFEGPPRDLENAPTRTGIALQRQGHMFQMGRMAVADAVAAPAFIEVRSAREHNLASVDVRIPHGALSVVTGPSGSGKSSLVFDVIYAEGQRRFLETLSPYARSFLPTLPRPDVDSVHAVPPAIALEQRLARAGAASTVATVTEISQYLRLLFAKVGVQSCPTCGHRVVPMSEDEIARQVAQLGPVRALVLAPAVVDRKGAHREVFLHARDVGVSAAWVDGVRVDIKAPPKLARTKSHTILLEICSEKADRVQASDVARALDLGRGSLCVRTAWGEVHYSTLRACPMCKCSLPDLDPRWFSFTTKQGMCPSCQGAGLTEEGDTCDGCLGQRLGPVPRSVRVAGMSLPELLMLDVTSAHDRISGWSFSGADAAVADPIVREVARRLEFMRRLGLEYLTLERRAPTLSGGEMQRLRLSAQLGSGLTGALYVFDEPTIGLHPRDTQRLIGALRDLVALGSTVLLVEHDMDTIRAADHIVELGPRGGSEGGRVVFAGAFSDISGCGESATAAALMRKDVEKRAARGRPDEFIELLGARGNNLRGMPFRVPVGRLSVVVGVSGSGKSTLVRKEFLSHLRTRLGLVTEAPPTSTAVLTVPPGISRALSVDQLPIGRSSRSVPATFLSIYDDIRRIFAALPDAKVRGFGPAHFSFNAVNGGRCAACEGQGMISTEMTFLPEVSVPCEACEGMRFGSDVLEVRFRGLSIGEVLRLSAREATLVFEHHPRIVRPLSVLCELGAGYIRIGQSSSTLSGGEAQRLKLASELSSSASGGQSVYVLDEPTTGLHARDVAKLERMLARLVDRGDTLVVIEHNPELIREADWVVELGPGGGRDGGTIVFEGTVEDLVRAKTATGIYLANTG